VLHARALLTLTDGDAAEAAALALRAAERAEEVRAPVPAARCRMLAGAALAQAGDGEGAVRLLTGAQRALASCEANRYRDEAARHLRRLGQRVSARQRRFGARPGLDALSGRELEIADRVALGSTNRQIADELYLSQKTVEGHLTSVFAKLGVSSRAEVAEAVGRARASH
jgi:DNA-binding CsgD family transcriptional regulator